jgi:hypothetical protein
MKIFAFVFTFVLFLPRLLVPQPLPVFVGEGTSSDGQRRSIVRDSRGWLYVVYTDSLHQIISKSSTDDGQSWPIYYILNRIGTSVEGEAPALAVAKGDTLYAVWKQSFFDSLGHWGTDVFWSRFDGSAWTPMANVSRQLFDSNSSDYPALVVDPANHPHVVWDVDYSPYEVFYSRYDSAFWTPPEIVSGGGSFHPTLGVDSAGDLHLAYYAGNISYRKHTGGVWGSPTIIGSGGRPCIAVDFLGHLHVVWYDLISGNVEVFYSYFNGSSWSPPLNLSNNIGVSMYPTVSCDARNNLYVAWQDNSMDTTKFERVFYRTFDGTSWSPITVINTDTTWFSGGPNIGYPVTDSGVDIVWTQWYNNQLSVMYRRLPLVGTGVEGENQKTLKEGSLKLTVQSPARHELNVNYSLPFQSKISLILYDLSGRKVMVLDEGEKATGRYEVKRSLGLPAGVYFLRLVSGREALTRKVVVIR